MDAWEAPAPVEPLRSEATSLAEVMPRGVSSVHVWSRTAGEMSTFTGNMPSFEDPSMEESAPGSSRGTRAEEVVRSPKTPKWMTITPTAPRPLSPHFCPESLDETGDPLGTHESAAKPQYRPPTPPLLDLDASANDTKIITKKKKKKRPPHRTAKVAGGGGGGGGGGGPFEVKKKRAPIWTKTTTCSTHNRFGFVDPFLHAPRLKATTSAPDLDVRRRNRPSSAPPRRADADLPSGGGLLGESSPEKKKKNDEDYHHPVVVFAELRRPSSAPAGRVRVRALDPPAIEVEYPKHRDMWQTTRRARRLGGQAPRSVNMPSGRTPTLGVGGVGSAASGGKRRYQHVRRLVNRFTDSVDENASLNSDLPRIFMRPPPTPAKRLPSNLMFARDAGIFIPGYTRPVGATLQDFAAPIREDNDDDDDTVT